MSGTLYLTATPIGNLGDMTPRSLQTLEQVDFVAAEDTRNSLRLLTHFGISKPLVSYHEHNKQTAGAAIVRRLLDGESCALVTDAGMPAISDPGTELVAACREAGVEVRVLPGASAVVCAVALSGMGGRFCFEGFLPTDNKARRAALERIAAFDGLVVLYEAPHRLAQTLQELQGALGDAELAIVKEISKVYERTAVLTLNAAPDWLAQNPPQGEYALVVQVTPKPPEKPLDGAKQLARELTELGVSDSSAAKYAAKKFSCGKNEIYAFLHQNNENI